MSNKISCNGYCSVRCWETNIYPWGECNRVDEKGEVTSSCCIFPLGCSYSSKEKDFECCISICGGGYGNSENTEGCVICPHFIIGTDGGNTVGCCSHQNNNTRENIFAPFTYSYKKRKYMLGNSLLPEVNRYILEKKLRYRDYSHKVGLFGWCYEDKPLGPIHQLGTNDQAYVRLLQTRKKIVEDKIYSLPMGDAPNLATMIMAYV